MKLPDLHLLESASLPYLISVPDKGTPAQGWPLLFFLHGYDEGAPMEIQRALTANGPLKAESSTRAVTEFIVAAPQLPLKGDLWYRFEEEVLEVVREVMTTFPVNRSRAYLTGFSFGGNGVFDLAGQQRGRWAALWAVDPTRVPEEDPGCPVWLSSGAVSRRQESAFIAALQLQTISPGEVPDRVYVDKGFDHVGTATDAYKDDKIYEWLLEKKNSTRAGQAF